MRPAFLLAFLSPLSWPFSRLSLTSLLAFLSPFCWPFSPLSQEIKYLHRNNGWDLYHKRRIDSLRGIPKGRMWRLNSKTKLTFLSPFFLVNQRRGDPNEAPLTFLCTILPWCMRGPLIRPNICSIILMMEKAFVLGDPTPMMWFSGDFAALFTSERS